MKTVVVLLSGGQDSTTCLFYAAARMGAERIVALSVHYGQRHQVEIEAAGSVLGVFRKHYPAVEVVHEIVPVPRVLTGSSPLTDLSREVGTYQDAASLPGGLEDTFVPARNILFLTIAANRAKVFASSVIVTGTAQEDFGGYPDCRQTFMDAMANALHLGLELDEHAPRMAIETPLMNLSKRETVILASELPGCLEALAFSHTCYQGQVPPCGVCHACLLRARGFDEAGISDPLVDRCAAEAATR